MTLEATPEVLPVWRGLTAETYDAMVDAGLLEGAPVELLEGLLVEMATQGEPHIEANAVLTRWFARRLPDPWILRPRGPLAAGAASVPERDLAVALHTPGVRPRTAAEVIEVAETSQRKDLIAEPVVHAVAGVNEHSVLDLPRRGVVVQTGPGSAGYAVVRRLPWTTALPVPVDGVEDLDLAALLPG